jgi:GT2 family glycosyltransferase
MATTPLLTLNEKNVLTTSELMNPVLSQSHGAIQTFQLHDGVKDVGSINVLAMFRNNEPFLRFFLPKLERMAEMYSCEFRYFFIENDSTDGTRELLKAFFAGQSRKGKLLLGKLDKDYSNVGAGMNYDRTMTLARLRNTVADVACQTPSDWTLWLDSHIFFDADILHKLFAIEPMKNDIGMIAPYTCQVSTLAQVRRLLPQVRMSDGNEDPERLMNMKHYYDTYPFISSSGHSYYPYCSFQRCMQCVHVHPPDMKLPLVPASQKVVDVQSCFGGLVLMDSSIIADTRIRWGTLSHSYTGLHTLSEHVLFCDRLRSITGKRVVVVQDVEALRTY